MGGYLSQTYAVTVDRGISRGFTVDLGDRQLWPPADPLTQFEVADLSGRTDVLLWGRRPEAESLGLRRLAGATGEPAWDVGLETTAGSVPFHSHPSVQPGGREGGLRLLRPAPDLDGDGTRDLVFGAGPGVASPLLATSGRDGRRLLGSAEGWAVGEPAVADVDGDGRPDVIAALTSANPSDRSWWVEAFSGRSGRSLWRRPLDRTWIGDVRLESVQAGREALDYIVRLPGQAGRPQPVPAGGGPTGGPACHHPRGGPAPRGTRPGLRRAGLGAP